MFVSHFEYDTSGSDSLTILDTCVTYFKQKNDMDVRFSG